MSLGKILSYLKAYLVFSKRERHGMAILLGLLGLIITGIRLVPEHNRQKAPAEFLNLQRIIDSLYTDVDSVETIQVHEYRASIQKNTRIELNRSDSSMLIQLPDIGPVFASRIIKYRNLLGGYYSINQLKEVYGLKEKQFSRATKYLIVNSTIIKGISVDTASYRTLARHPYIGKERAWKIIDLRKRLSTPMSPDDIKNALIFDSLQWKRIEPYLIFLKINRSEIN